MKKQSIIFSEISAFLESSRSLIKYKKRVKIQFTFLKLADESLQMYLIAVREKRKHCYIVYDSSLFCYAFCDQKLPIKKIIAWGRMYKKLFYIEKWQEIDAKKFCYEYF